MWMYRLFISSQGRALRLLAVTCLLLDAVASSQADEVLVNLSSNRAGSLQQVEMLTQSSKVLSIEGKIPQFRVNDEQLVTVTPIAENQLQLFANSPGVTQIDLWDSERRHYPVRISVLADNGAVEALLNSQIPSGDIRLIPTGNSAILSGTVTDAADAKLALAIAERSYPAVIDNLKVVGLPQVLLHTKIMEVSRTKLRDAGIDWSLGSKPTLLGSTACDQGHGLRSQLVGDEFPTLIAALRRDNLIKLLAEPTVVATHGRTAKFRSGGKVPSMVAGTCGASAIQYEEYGTSIEFLPLVIAPDRLRLEVRPEVSEPDAAKGIHHRGIRAPAFTTRALETEVEMHSGQTLVLAGLIQCRSESSVQKVPVLGEVPLVGGIFRRVREQQNEIELLIMITPELVTDHAHEPSQYPGTLPPPADFLEGAVRFEQIPSTFGSLP